MPQNKDSYESRRKFIAGCAKVMGSAMLLATPLHGFALQQGSSNAIPVTVGQIIDLFISQVKGAPFPAALTVDNLKSGDRNIVVTGVVTTMFATIDVIRKAIAYGANFIIAHEPTFYNHKDETKWIEHDEVYQYKAALLKEHNIAVWRNHDYIHSLHPDGVTKALIEQLGWTRYGDPDQHVYNFETAVPLKTLITDLKRKLNIPMLRYIGNPAQACKKILLQPGAAGVNTHITNVDKYKPDVLICGEIAEWETAEYIRDARAKGQQTALIVLGHIASEEIGSKYVSDWLHEKFPALKSIFIPAGNSLSFM